MAKRGAGSNCFDQTELRRYYDDSQQCFRCNMWGASDFHHNVPRARKYTSSILNAIPLCRSCHMDDSDYYSEKRQTSFFLRNIRFLNSRNYEFKEIDKEYIVEYPHLAQAFINHANEGKEYTNRI